MVKELEQFVELTDEELKEVSGGMQMMNGDGGGFTGVDFITGPLTDHNK